MAELKELTKYKRLLNKHLIIDDWKAVDLILAIMAAHKIPGEMLWVRVIGTPSTGKTEILNTLAAQDGYCSKLESLTPASIRRGYVPQDGKHLPTMLERIDGKLVVTKELAPLLTTNKELKLETFGLLRSLHDGEIVADYGSAQGHIEQKCHFDWILGTTQYVDRQAQLEAQLGSRFIDLRWGKPIDHRGATIKAMQNDASMQAIRDQLAKAVNQLIKAVNPDALPELTKGEYILLADLANFTTKYRTPVERDARTKVITNTPETEFPPRVGQALARITKGLMLVGIADYKPYLQRMALDCLPPLRSGCIKALLNGHNQGRDIATRLKVSSATVSHVLEDLKVLGFDTVNDLPLISDAATLQAKCK